MKNVKKKSKRGIVSQLLSLNLQIFCALCALHTRNYIVEFPSQVDVFFYKWWGAESSLPVAHPGYQVLSDILLRLGLIANALTQCGS